MTFDQGTAPTLTALSDKTLLVNQSLTSATATNTAAHCVAALDGQNSTTFAAGVTDMRIVNTCARNTTTATDCTTISGTTGAHSERRHTRIDSFKADTQFGPQPGVFWQNKCSEISSKTKQHKHK